MFEAYTFLFVALLIAVILPAIFIYLLLDHFLFKKKIAVQKPRLLNVIGSLLKTLLALVLWLFMLMALISIFSYEEKVDGKILIKNTDFQMLQHMATDLKGITNVAVLPEQNYIVINGLVFNLKKKTYGHEPDLGFYNSYYSEGDKTPYDSIDNVFSANKINLTGKTAAEIIEKMKKTRISDIAIHKEEHSVSYRWKVSAMHGEEGILYSQNPLKKEDTHYDSLETLDKNFYFFRINH